jgi:hypothetical protein
MATLKSTNINAGDPVTADIINNLVLDLNELNKATSPSFQLVLGNQTVAKPDSAAVSQKIYSKPITTSVNDGAPKNITWKFSDSGIKFNSVPRCWVQLQNTNTSTDFSAFNFMIVITAVSTTSMTFQVRGSNFKTATHTFVCFAADA